MALPLDYQSPSKPPRPTRIPRVIIGLLLLVGLGVLLFRPLMSLLMAIGFHGTSQSVSPADASRSVAFSLMQWGVFGTASDENSILHGVTGINGYTESDGFHGDGTDWYEIQLSPDLAAQLRSGLARATAVKKSKPFPGHWGSSPSWWPSTWPADAQCYETTFDCLILPDTGTRAWFMRRRS